MSRRYGRNQRRRAREELAACFQALCDSETRALQLDRRNAQLDERNAQLRERIGWIEEAATLLRYPGVLPPQSVPMRDPIREPMRVGQDRLNGFDFVAPGDVEQYSAFPVVDLYVLSLAIATDPINFAFHVHLFSEGYGPLAGKWAYRVSPEMLRTGIPRPARNRFALSIASELLAAADRHFQRVLP